MPDWHPTTQEPWADRGPIALLLKEPGTTFIETAYHVFDGWTLQRAGGCTRTTRPWSAFAAWAQTGRDAVHWTYIADLAPPTPTDPAQENPVARNCWTCRHRRMDADGYAQCAPYEEREEVQAWLEQFDIDGLLTQGMPTDPTEDRGGCPAWAQTGRDAVHWTYIADLAPPTDPAQEDT